MSHCPTCGHRADDELVHSTPVLDDGVRLRPDTQWRSDLAELITLVRTVVSQQRGPLMTPFHVDKRRRAREQAQLRRVA